MNAARKGDLVLIDQTNSYTSLTTGTHITRNFQLHVVAATNREGIITKIRRIGSNAASSMFNRDSYVLPASQMDVNAIIETVLAGDWTADSFETLEAAREFLAPFRRVAPAVVTVSGVPVRHPHIP